MSQIRKIKRKINKSQPTKQKGRNVMIWMAALAAILIIIVAILGFRLLNNDAEPAAEARNLNDSEIVLLSTASDEPIALPELTAGENGKAFVFFLGLG
jgi:flagellar basal body-associated protein FliL